MGNEYGACEEVQDSQECLHQHKDGSWWFFDETMAYEHGPFSSREAADAHLGKYIDAFNMSNHQIMTRMEKT